MSSNHGKADAEDVIDITDSNNDDIEGNKKMNRRLKNARKI